MLTCEGLTNQSADPLDPSVMSSVGNKLIEALSMQYGCAILNLSKDFSSAEDLFLVANCVKKYLDSSY